MEEQIDQSNFEIPLQEYFDNLLSMWTRIQPSYWGEDRVLPDEWGKFSVDFNKNLREKIAVLEVFKRNHDTFSIARYGVEALVGIFTMWQYQYRMITNRSGQVIKSRRYRRDLQVYRDLSVSVKKSISQYNTLVKQYQEKKGNNHGGDIQEIIS